MAELVRSWIRLYTDLPNNPKVQRLPPKVFKFWINCLCLYGKKGYLPPVPDIAWALQLTENQTLLFVKHLVSARLFDESDSDQGFENILVNSLTPHDWDNLQFESDSSKERVARYRQAMKKSGGTFTQLDKFRTEVLQRDNGKCIYCLSDKSLVMDHIYPLKKGGKTEIWNLATACRTCNSGKSGRTPYEASYTVAARHAVTLVDTAIERHVTVTVTPQEQSRAEQIQSRAEQKPRKTRGEESDIAALADSLHGRHPSNGCGKAAIQKHLRTIVGKLSPGARAEMLILIDKNHAAWCGTDNWKRGYSKGLENWLSPSMQRWKDPPPADAPRQQSGIEAGMEYLRS